MPSRRRRLRAAAVTAWRARWRPLDVRAGFRAGFRTGGLLQAVRDLAYCEAAGGHTCRLEDARAVWSELERRDVTLCDGHAVQLEWANANRRNRRAHGGRR